MQSFIKSRAIIAVAIFLICAGWLPSKVFAFDFPYTWPSYSGGSATVSDTGIFTLTGSSDVFFEIAGNVYGSGGINQSNTPNLNNLVYANFGATTTRGWVCFSQDGGGSGTCSDSSIQIPFVITVTGVSGPTDACTSCLIGISDVLDTSTHFIGSIPADRSTVATSTSFVIGVTGYISEADFANDPTITVHVDNSTARLSQSIFLLAPIAVNGDNSAAPFDKTFNFTPTAPGPFSVTATTSLTGIGGYYIHAVMTQPQNFLQAIESIFFQTNSEIASADFYFKAATTSVADAFTDQATTSQYLITDAVNNARDNCTSLVTTPLQCVAYLVIPTQAGIDVASKAIYDGLATRPPFGYITRFWNIMQATNVTEPPALTYTFGSSSPAELQGKSVSYQIWDYVGSSSPLLLARADDGSNKNLWEIVDPYFAMVVSFAVLGSILVDVLGFALEQAEMLDFKWRAAARQKARQGERNKRMYQSTITTPVKRSMDDHMREVNRNKRLFQSTVTSRPRTDSTTYRVKRKLRRQ